MNSNHITLDFETRSEADLKKVGAWMYSIHPSTEILCMAYRLPGETVTKLWHPNSLKKPLDLCSAIQWYPIEAHNAWFEFSIWTNILGEKHEFPRPKGLWLCSQAKGSALALPRKLENLAKALNLPVEKDMVGHKLMLKMCKPRKKTKTNSDKWHEDFNDMERLFEYCIADVDTEIAASNDMVDLSEDEQEAFQLDLKINTRGIYCDVESCKKATKFVALYTEELNNELSRITDGKVTKATQVLKLRGVLEQHGLLLEDLSKSSIVSVLADEGINSTARRMLEIRQAVAKSSVKKFVSMVKWADPKDNRIRGTLLYHGASTGRWSGKGVQPHNFTKAKKGEKPDEMIADINAMDYPTFRLKYPNVMEALSSCLRGMLCAPEGKELIVADFAAIEARVLVWLVGDLEAVAKFANDEDLYIEMASEVFNREIKEDDKERGLGKVIILACGFGMGKVRFLETCFEWGVPTTKEIADISVDAYRAKYPKVVKFWYDIERAAIRAIKTGNLIKSEKLQLKVVNDYLFIKLPNGRKLAYRSPRIEPVMTPWGQLKDQMTFMGTNSKTKKWERQSTYGGKLTENIVQAIARDLMKDGMIRVEDNYPVIASIHDELVSEVDAGYGSVEEYEKLMSEVPEWAKGCPVAAKGWRGKRYRK